MQQRELLSKNGSIIRRGWTAVKPRLCLIGNSNSIVPIVDQRFDDLFDSLGSLLPEFATAQIDGLAAFAIIIVYCAPLDIVWNGSRTKTATLIGNTRAALNYCAPEKNKDTGERQNSRRRKRQNRNQHKPVWSRHRTLPSPIRFLPS